ncbi:MAG: succinate dehydrogenase, hydrophobic membrane anchor protein [Methyloceanibacter sp.]|jgi:succinate dehydrogenase / fumarate reductase membrane anchor subunit
MATPLKRVRGLGAARHGTETFWRQRLTAVANVPLVIFLIWFVVSHAGASYDSVRQSLSNPMVAVLMLALIWSSAIHMRIGLREIIEDYLHNKLCKTSSRMLATFFAAGVAIASTYAIMKISFGG